MKKLLVILDPIQRLNPRTDTSLIFARESKLLGFEVFLATPEALYWETSGVYVRALPMLEPGDESNRPSLGQEKTFLIIDFNQILIRKEPPFDSSYLHLCWLLKPYENIIRIWNSPSVLLGHHEKMIPLDAVARGYLDADRIIETCVTSQTHMAEEFIQRIHAEEVIVKPWLGFGGNKIQKWKAEDLLQNIHTLFSKNEVWMLQAFQSDITEVGDRRVFFAKGEYLGDFVRLPQGESFVSNLAQGGKAVLKEMSLSERESVSQLGHFLKSEAIDFAGADLIGNRVSEVNITCPTGLEAFEKLSGKKLAPEILKRLS